MRKELNIRHFGETSSVSFEFPEECPVCRSMGRPVVIYEGLADVDDKRCRVFVGLYYCALCHQCFLFNQSLDNEIEDFRHITARVDYISPMHAEPPTLSRKLRDISPRLESVLQQCYEAEGDELHEIVGGGFRKALEIIVRDYVEYITPGSLERLKDTALRNIVKDHLPREAEFLRAAADKCALLGNDQSHYFYEYPAKDIKDIKNLLEATIHFIEMAILASTPL